MMIANLRPQEIDRLRLAMRDAGGESFFRRLRNLLRGRLRMDTLLLMRFAPQTAPELLAARMRGEIRPKALSAYLDGAYRLDPFYLKRDVPPDGAMYQLSEIAPDRFFTSEYFVHYYRDTQLIDEIGLLVPLEDGGIGHLSFSRLDRTGRFRRKELACLRRVSPLLLQLLHLHFKTLTPPQPRGPDAPDLFHQQIRAEMLAIAGIKLTDRESQIAALVLQGHSNGSAALALDISRETAKVHRRNLYRKLHISSQAELFTLLKSLL